MSRNLKALALSIALCTVSTATAEARPRARATSQKQKAVAKRIAKPAKKPMTILQRFTARQAEAERLLRRTKIETREPSGQNVNLAVTDLEMRQPVRIITVRGKVSRTPGFTVAAEKDKMNGVGTCYQVLEPAGLVVVTMKIRGGNPAAKGSAAGRKADTTHVLTYVPCTNLYTAELRTALIAEGRRYLVQGTFQASRALASVPSRMYRGKTVADVIPHRFQPAKVLTEHTDPDEFFAADARGKIGMFESALASIGANRRSTYRQSWSRVGKDDPKRNVKKGDLIAGGMVQFICPSYEMMRANYPAAGLSPSVAKPDRLPKGAKPRRFFCRRIAMHQFVAALNDHANAFKAMYLHDDYCSGALRNASERLATRLRRGGKLGYGNWLAAAYNGGCPAAIGSLIRNPERWIRDGSHLAPETQGYVIRFTAAYRYLWGTDPVAESEPLSIPGAVSSSR